MNPASIPHTKDDDTAYTHHLLSIQELVKKNLKTTQERMKKYANLKRKDAPEYKVGDLVMLDGRNIKIRRLKDKLDHKKHSTFAIEKWYRQQQYDCHYPKNGRSIIPSMYPYLTHTIMGPDLRETY
jgi:hypothetical protein